MERFALVLASLILAGPAAAQVCSRQSPPHTVALLELYTSEGCSSCPPADRFVSGLRAASGLTAEQVVPLALHVDYWDYIGWKDRFARRDFTERQRWLSAQANSRTIYTPEIFMGGKEWRDWRGNPATAIKRINARPAQATIEIALGKVEGGKLPLTVKAGTAASQAAQLFVALYENGLSSDVKTGENSGTVLHHDYVVREWLGPFSLTGLAGEGGRAFTRTLALPPGAVAGKLGVAAFVQNAQGEVLQALSLGLCAN